MSVSIPTFISRPIALAPSSWREIAISLIAAHMTRSKPMRNATLCFLLLLLCPVFSFGQQWQVVQHVELFNQTQAIPVTTLLTPTDPSIYRISFYFSAGPETRPGFTVWEANLNGTELSGTSLNTQANVHCGNPSSFSSTSPVAISLKPRVPLTYQVQLAGLQPCQYNLTIIVEQLLTPEGQ